MKNNFPIIIGILLILLVSGCTTYETKDAEVSIKDVLTDKDTYHSSETMKVKVIVDSSLALENVTVSLSGINGKLNEKNVTYLEKGLNEIEFSYELPRCNVCGGISEGDYDIKCEVVYGEDISLMNIKTVSIQQ